MIKLDIKPDEFEQAVASGFWIVDFFSETCGPCKALSKILDELHFDYPSVNIAKINTTKHPEFSQKFDIKAVPLMLFVSEGEIKERHLGLLRKEQLEEKINTNMYE